MEYDKQAVQEFLPHRSPFLFIDTVERIILPEGLEQKETYVEDELRGVVIEANFFADPDLPLFQGHFPGNPILPGVIQIEMMAQASAFSSIRRFVDHRNYTFDMALLTVNGAKFRRPIVPGDHVKIFCKFTKARGNMKFHDSWIEVDGKRCAEATLMASLIIEEKK
jgi:3-hydroxyacyl-[acyl-carrier-protein] dehydratase